MVNENIQGNIELVGPGYTRKAYGDYGPGEFFTMINCELDEFGTITTRRPVTAHTLDSHLVASNQWRNVNTIVGHWKDGIITSGNDKMAYIYNGDNLEPFNWGPPEVTAALTAAAGAGNVCRWSKLVGFVRYNRINYWLFLSNFDRLADNQYWFEYNLYYADERSYSFELTGGSIINVSSLPAGTVRVFSTKPTLTETPSSNPGGTTPAGALVQKLQVPPIYRNMFIHKDRLWIVTDSNVLFSKATLPHIWEGPDGGFFLFDEKKIQSAVAYRDSIYVICDNSVDVITYNLDPNDIADVTVKEISNSIGGDSAVVVGDIVYFAKDDYMYAITGQTLTKVMDLNLKLVWPQNKKWRLVPFGHYIIAMHVTPTVNTGQWPATTYSENAVITPNNWGTSDFLKYGHLPPTRTWNMFGGDTGDSLSGNEGDVFFINTENASIHGFAYDQGLVCDMYFVPDENTIDEQWLWIMTKKFVSTNNTDVQFSYMSLEQGPKLNTAYSPKDTGLSTSTGASSFVNFNIPIWLEYHKYRPDGSANLMKKYRSMIIEGSIPNHTKYSFNFTDSYTTGWPVGTDLVSTNSQDMVGPLTSRIGINQRARGLTFRLFRASENYTETPVNPLNINRITVLWSYTGRAPTGRNPAWGKDPQSSL